MLQLRIIAYDTSYPNNPTTATLTIPVTRNVNTPEFTKTSYSAQILENSRVGFSVLEVSAKDKDKVHFDI